MICKPKSSGGLGIIDFRKQNEGLLMKHLHKFFNKEDIPWVHLVWRYYPQGYLKLLSFVASSSGEM
jgi:hypothetical protein